MVEIETQLELVKEQIGGEELKPAITDDYFKKVSYKATVEGKEREIKGKNLR